MRNIFTIIKKEFARFFKDKRMVITVLLPGLLIYILYSLMGSVFSGMGGVDEDYKPTACVINAPLPVSSSLSLAFAVSNEAMTEEDAKQKIKDGTLDVLVIFPEDFSLEIGETQQNVKVFYNLAKDNSSYGYQLMTAFLNAMNKTAFTVNFGDEQYNLADDSSMAVKMMSMIVPMLMFALLASACIAVAPESIAGEKERGTMATMLITPVNRVEIALGKIISLSCFALISGISSFVGVILSLPKLMDGALNLTEIPYGAGEYFMIFGLIVSIVLVIISAFSVLSALAKSVKEAGTLITPLMMVIILMGMASMVVSSPSVWLNLIPLLGSGLAISSIMSLTASSLGVGLAVLSNIIAAALLVVLLAFMFKSEKIMFKK